LSDRKELTPSRCQAHCNKPFGVLCADIRMQRVADDRAQAGAQFISQFGASWPFTHFIVFFLQMLKELML
jgi:hypothetical protein